MKNDSVMERKKTSKNKFSDNKTRKRYELELGDGYLAKIDYFVTRDGDIALTHTEVPYECEGQGFGSELVEFCLEDIRNKGVKVIPQCGFVASYIRSHPEWQELVINRYM